MNFPENIEETNIRLVQEALRESEERYRHLAELSPDAIVIHSDGKIVYINPVGISLFGAKSEEELVGEPLLKFVHPDYRDIVVERVRILTQEEKHVPLLTEKFLRLDNSIIDVEVVAMPIVYQGKPAVQVAFRDISERKRAEEERKAHIHFLESLEQVNQVITHETDVEQMLQKVIETVFAIFLCDRAWLLYPCNPEAPSVRVPIEIYRSEYAGAKVLNVEIPMDPELANDLQTIIASKDPLSYTNGTERPVNRSTAQQFAVQSQMVQAIFPKIGQPWVFGMHQCSHPRIWTENEKELFKEIGRRVGDGLNNALLLRDIQESRQQLQNYSEELKAANETKDKFFSIISHDLRSPFSGLLGVSNFLSSEIDSLTRNEIKDLSEELNEALQKQYELLSNLLDWARIQKKDLALHIETVFLRNELNKVIEQLTLTAAQKEIQIRNKVGDDFRVSTDINMLKLIFLNLISNGIKFTNKNGFVEISAVNKENFIEVTVSDNGIGIAKEIMEKLFKVDILYSTEGTTKERGTGLGLVLCKDTVEKLGGRIWVESECGKGSKFIFTLPITYQN